ncbi:hypothetical protein I6A84_30095, partial [Frankia sp. CNm7]
MKDIRRRSSWTRVGAVTVAAACAAVSWTRPPPAAPAPGRLIRGGRAARSARHREVAATGYAMSAVSRIGLLA